MTRPTVTIGTGPDDPRAWVRAAYAIFDAARRVDSGDKLPAQAEIARTLGVSLFTARHALPGTRAHAPRAPSPRPWLLPGRRDVTANPDPRPSCGDNATRAAAGLARRRHPPAENPRVWLIETDAFTIRSAAAPSRAWL